jgi:hypothetical protein
MQFLQPGYFIREEDTLISAVAQIVFNLSLISAVIFELLSFVKNNFSPCRAHPFFEVVAVTI